MKGNRSNHGARGLWGLGSRHKSSHKVDESSPRRQLPPVPVVTIPEILEINGIPNWERPDLDEPLGDISFRPQETDRRASSTIPKTVCVSKPQGAEINFSPRSTTDSARKQPQQQEVQFHHSNASLGVADLSTSEKEEGVPGVVSFSDSTGSQSSTRRGEDFIEWNTSTRRSSTSKRQNWTAESIIDAQRAQEDEVLHIVLERSMHDVSTKSEYDARSIPSYDQRSAKSATELSQSIREANQHKAMGRSRTKMYSPGMNHSRDRLQNSRSSWSSLVFVLDESTEQQHPSSTSQDASHPEQEALPCVVQPETDQPLEHSKGREEADETELDENMSMTSVSLAELEQDRELLELAMQVSLQDSMQNSLSSRDTSKQNHPSMASVSTIYYDNHNRPSDDVRLPDIRRSQHMLYSPQPQRKPTNYPLSDPVGGVRHKWAKGAPPSLYPSLDLDPVVDVCWSSSKIRQEETEDERLDRIEREMLEAAMERSLKESRW